VTDWSVSISYNYGVNYAGQTGAYGAGQQQQGYGQQVKFYLRFES